MNTIMLSALALCCAISFCAALPAATHGPGVPRVQQVRFETQDYVIVTHDIRDYGVAADHGKDVTAAFQKAIDAVHADGGGVLFVPAGRYQFRDRLLMKSGVHIRGEWQSPEQGPSATEGTLFEVYYGKGQPDAAPFLTMAQSSGLKDLAIWYPEQNFSDPIPFAWTVQQIKGLSCGLENITMYNAWRGIQTGPEGNQLMTVKNWFITALDIAFLRDSIYDCQKLQKIRMSPRIWEESGLPGAPVTQADRAALRQFLLRESVGAVVTHYDWTWMYDWTIEGFHTGVRLTRSAVKTDDRGPNGGWVGLELIDNAVGIEVGDVNRCGWSDVGVVIRSQVPDAIGIKVLKELKSVAQFLNVTFDGSFKACVWSEAMLGSVTMASCQFNSWAQDGRAVDIKAGVVEIVQSGFNQPGRQIFLGPRTTSAAFLGNTFAGDPVIVDKTTAEATVIVDHSPLTAPEMDLSRFEFPDAIWKPAHATLFNVRDFGAKGDAASDDYPAFVAAFKAAEANGGGTVYVPVGQYAIHGELVVPTGVEFRGIFDNSHHTADFILAEGRKLGQREASGQRGSELFAYSGKGDENGTAFIRLETKSSIRGLTIYYPEQKWSDFKKNGVFTPFPWTIQSLGPEARLKDVLLVNAYNGADFGTHDSTGHNIDYLCGAALNTGLYIDNCFGKGYVKNVQWNPSFWGWSDYPDRPDKQGSRTLRNTIRYTLTAFIFGYSEYENVLQTFSFGTKTGVKFINNPQHGGVNGIFLAHGIDHSGVSMIFEDVGDDAQFVNFQIVSMEVDDRRRYLDIHETVQGKAQFYGLLGWGHNPCAEIGIDMRGGDFSFVLTSLASHGLTHGIKQTGGKLQTVGFRFNEKINAKIAGGYQSGIYGFFGPDIESAELIGSIIKKGSDPAAAFVNEAGAKAAVVQTIEHNGY